VVAVAGESKLLRPPSRPMTHANRLVSSFGMYLENNEMVKLRADLVGKYQEYH